MKHYKIKENENQKYEVYFRKNIFCKWRLLEKYIGQSNGDIYAKAIFPTKEAANIFIEEMKTNYGKVAR